jgi:hypothetical protein
MSKVYKKIVGGGKYLQWKSWQVGDWVEGVLVGTVEDKYKKTNFQIQVTECSLADSCQNAVEDEKADAAKKKRAVKFTSLEVKPGDTLVLNSMGTLNFKMGNVSEGQSVKVTYLGTEVLPDNHQYGGAESHQVDVETVEESTRGL